VCIVELRVTINYIETLSVAKNALWQIYLSGNNKTCLGVHANCPILTKFGASKQTSLKALNIKCQTCVQWIRADTSGQTDMMKVKTLFATKTIYLIENSIL